VSKHGRSIKGDLTATLAEFDISTQTLCEGAPWIEEVDLLVVVLGCNDLNHQATGAEVAGRLEALRRLYNGRGAEVVLVSVGGAGPGEVEDLQDFEAERSWVNAWLLAEGGVVDCDLLLRDLDPGLWEDGWHLKKEGYRLFGDRIAEAVMSQSLSAGFVPRPDKRVEVLHVSGGQSPAVSSIITGPYFICGINHGRPVYERRRDAGGDDTVLLYFWDARDGLSWNGWWFAPRIDWNFPGWAYCDERSARSPPASGWRVPVEGPVDATLTISSKSSMQRRQP